MIRMKKKKKEDDLKIDLKNDLKIEKKKMIFLMIVDMIKKENLWLCEKVKYVRN